MKITRISECWFIGRLPGLVFFGYSEAEVLAKADRWKNEH
jgi:hypothetical protein